MIYFFGKKKAEYYNNILMKADKNLHKQLADLIMSLKLDRDCAILDFGCGEGALSQRLHDLGFTNITSVDIDQKSFKANTQFFQLDFNNSQKIKEFMNNSESKYDLVLGIEVIEHVENHYDYIRTLKSLTKKNAYILISTPNITSWLSRFYFLFTGRLHQFMEQDLSYGHVNPISLWQLKYIFKQNNIVLESVHEMGTLPLVYFNGFSMKQLIMNIFSIIMALFMKGEKKYGWCVTVIGRND